jgi:hypothetical protein
MFRNVLTAFAEEFKLRPVAGHHYVPDGKNWVDKTEFDRRETSCRDGCISRGNSPAGKWQRRMEQTTCNRFGLPMMPAAKPASKRHNKRSLD